VQSFKSKFERGSPIFKVQFSNSACRHCSIQRWPRHWLQSWAKFARKEATYTSQHNNTNVATFFAFGKVWRFERFISSILSYSMRARRCFEEHYGKERVDESEISIHSSPTSGCVFFKRKSFVCVDLKDFKPVGHCSVHFTAESVLLEHFMRKVQRNI